MPARMFLIAAIAALPLLAGCDDDDDDFDNRTAVTLRPGDIRSVILEIKVDESEDADFVVECGFVSICGIDAGNLDAIVEFAGVSGEVRCAARISVGAYADALPGFYEICARFYYVYVDFFGFLYDDDTRGYIEVTVADEQPELPTPTPSPTVAPPG